MPKSKMIVLSMIGKLRFSIRFVSCVRNEILLNKKVSHLIFLAKNFVPIALRQSSKQVSIEIKYHKNSSNKINGDIIKTNEVMTAFYISLNDQHASDLF
jgi:hypothetical protein